MRKITVLLVAIIIAITAIRAYSADFETIRYTLKNGMVVILAPDHSTPAVSMNIWVNVGAYNECDAESGMSHFIEHLLFKGTASLGPGEGAALIEGAGGAFNAYTNFDNTVLTASVASRFVETLIRVVSDTALHAAFAPEEVERERQVILEEIRRDLDDPKSRIVDLLFSTAFSGHPYGKPVIGTMEKVASYSRDDLFGYYMTHYKPDNMTVVLVGDFDPKAVKPLIERYLGDSVPSGAPGTPTLACPVNRGTMVTGIGSPVHTAYLYIAFNAPPVTHDDLFALDTTSLILGHGRDSRLYRSVVDTGLANSVACYSYTPKEAGLFMVTMTLDASEIIPAVKTVVAEIAELAHGPVTDAELEKARTGTIADFIFDKETYDGMAQSLGFYETAAGSVNFERKYLAGIDGVTARDVMKTAKRYFTVDNMTIVYLIPSADEKTVSEAEIRKAALDAFSTPPAAVEALPELVAGPLGYKAVLPNGVRLVIKENHRLPLVSVVAAFDGGVRRESPENNGINNLISRMLGRGTTGLTAQAVAEHIDRIAADINGFSGRDSLGLKAEFLTKYEDEGWGLVADILTNPSFDTDELAKVKEITEAAIDRTKDNLPQRTIDLFKKTIYRSYPYAMPTIGTTESIRALTRDDLIGYWRTVAVPEHLVISVVGDVNPDEVLKRVVEHFGGLPRGAVALPEPPKVTRPARPVRVSETVADKEQAHIFYGFLGTDYRSDDLYDMEVLTAVLSGMGGRMFSELREKRGLAYSVDAFNVGGVGPGFFGVYMGTAPKNLSVAVDAIRQELSRVRRDGVTPDELNRAKNYLIGNFELSLQENIETASLMATDELYGLGYDFMLGYPKKIEAVTEADVKRIADDYLDPDGAVLTVVTPY